MRQGETDNKTLKRLATELTSIDADVFKQYSTEDQETIRINKLNRLRRWSFSFVAMIASCFFLWQTTSFMEAIQRNIEHLRIINTQTILILSFFSVIAGLFYLVLDKIIRPPTVLPPHEKIKKLAELERRDQAFWMGFLIQYSFIGTYFHWNHYSVNVNMLMVAATSLCTYAVYHLIRKAIYQPKRDGTQTACERIATFNRVHDSLLLGLLCSVYFDQIHIIPQAPQWAVTTALTVITAFIMYGARLAAATPLPELFSPEGRQSPASRASEFGVDEKETAPLLNSLSDDQSIEPLLNKLKPTWWERCFGSGGEHYMKNRFDVINPLMEQLTRTREDSLESKKALHQLDQLFKHHSQQKKGGDLLLSSHNNLESFLAVDAVIRDQRPNYYRLSHQPQTFSALIGLYAYGALATNDLPYAQAIQEACAAFMANQKYCWLEDSMNTFPQCFQLVKENLEEARRNYYNVEIPGQCLHLSRIQTTATPEAIQSAFEAKLEEILGLRSEAAHRDAPHQGMTIV